MLNIPEKFIDSKAALVSKLTNSEIVVAHAASKIINRVFHVNSITGRMNEKLSETTVYQSIHNLVSNGLLELVCNKSDSSISKNLSIKFTILGRECCALIKQTYILNTQLPIQQNLI